MKLRIWWNAGIREWLIELCVAVKYFNQNRYENNSLKVVCPITKFQNVAVLRLDQSCISLPSGKGPSKAKKLKLIWWRKDYKKQQ